MFKRWYRKAIRFLEPRNRFVLLILVVAVVMPAFGSDAELAKDKRQSGPSDISSTMKTRRLVVAPEPNVPCEPNMVTPDRLELSYGTSVHVEVVSVTLTAGGKERSWPRDAMRRLTVSRDGQAVLAVADARQVPGILVRVLVKSQAGMMAFDRDDVRALTIDAPQVKSGSLPSDSPLLVQNLLMREATIEKVKLANQAALAASAQKYEKPLTDAKAKVDAARQSHKLAKDAVARVRSDLTKREAEQTAYFQRYGRRDTQLGSAIRRLEDEHRAKASDNDAAAAKLQAAEEAQTEVIKNKNDEQRDLRRSLPAAIAKVHAQAAKHEFIMQSGGNLSERAMQKAFDRN